VSSIVFLVIELADFLGHPARLIARRHKAILDAHLRFTAAFFILTGPPVLGRGGARRTDPQSTGD
jgi:hypothetical protein